MRIIAIDPGTEYSAYVIMEGKDIISKEDQIENKELLKLIKTYPANLLLIEMVASYGMPVGKTTFETVYWIGRFCQCAITNNLGVRRLYKKIDINPTICFSNKAKDSNIRQAILDMYPATGGGKTPQVGTKSTPGPLFGVKGHIWSALAVGLTYLINSKLIER